ncbi:MAG: LytTR family DNA-binding domain-containing protein [Rhodothermales bacterium]
MPTPLRILIVDDERSARQRLADLLAETEDAQVVGEATTGPEAVQAIRSLAPDLVFLDVQMPGMTGRDVVRTVGPERMPAVIFVTAYDQHAVHAFEVAALDYLLKPFDDERFAQALGRARQTLALRDLAALRTQLADLLGPTPPAPTPAPERLRYLERIGVEERGHLRILPVERIDFITASGSYAELHVGDATFLIREQMQSLDDRLDPAAFFRIHRGTIVQLDRIDRLIYARGGDYAARLHDGRHLKVSRSKWEELAAVLGVS